jgi:DNA-binding response OmpR family regulator
LIPCQQLYGEKSHKFNVIHTLNVKETMNYLKGNKPDLIILDISLPDGNGFDLYKTEIKQRNLPTIFLTAKDEEDDIVKGLELGADDYITKPFSTRELVARINKILLKESKNLKIKIKDIEFDIDKMVVFKDSKEVNLTSLELKILNLLFTNLNKVVKREDIIEKVWEWTGNDINDNTVTVYLKRIREKLDSDIIKTIKGIGYRVDRYEE